MTEARALSPDLTRREAPGVRRQRAGRPRGRTGSRRGRFGLRLPAQAAPPPSRERVSVRELCPQLCPRHSEIARAQAFSFHTGDRLSKGRNGSGVRRALAPEASVPTARGPRGQVWLSSFRSVVCGMFSTPTYR